MLDANSEDKISELRSLLQSMEWDMGQGFFNKSKLPFYKSILRRYEKMKDKSERF